MLNSIETKRKFALIPVKTKSGRWIFGKHYVRVTEKYLQDLPYGGVGFQVIYQRFTEQDWVMEKLKRQLR